MRAKLAIIGLFVLILSFGTITVGTATGLPSLWETPMKVEGMSASRVFAVWYKDQLHIVHGGKNRDAIWHALWDGKQWMTNLASNLSGEGAPALAVYQDKLHMVYKGKNDTLWHATSEGKNWTPKGQILGQKSHYSPALILYPYDRFTAQPREYLWMLHSGGSKDSKRDLWSSLFDGSAWSDDEKMVGVSEGTVSLCMHKERLYMVEVNATGIIMTHYLKATGWAPVKTAPKGVHTTTPVSLASDGESLYMFYRQGRSEPGTEAPIYATVMTGERWEDPIPVKDFSASDSPAVVAVPGQKGQLYLLYTNRNGDIYFTHTGELRKQFKPLKQIEK